MATIHPSSPLPPNPFDDRVWLEYIDTYKVVLEAERHVNALLNANPLGREEMDNLVYARVTGYLLIELFDKRGILSVEPYTALALGITTPPRSGGPAHDFVFNLGRQYFCHFIRTCTSCPSPTSFTILVFLQIGRPPRGTHRQLNILRASPSTT